MSSAVELVSTATVGSGPSGVSPRNEVAPANGETRQSLIYHPGLVCLVLEGERRHFLLRGLFIVDMEEEDGTWRVSHRTLPVEGYGATADEALREFDLAFEIQWEDLVDADPDILSPGARRARERLQAAVAQTDPTRRLWRRSGRGT